MSDLKVNNITSRDGNHGPIVAGVSTVASTGFMVMPSGNTEIRGASSGRGVIVGGYPAVNTLQFVRISTLGNATDFGDLTRTTYENTSVGSATRGVTMGGIPATFTIDYFIFSSGGGANDFGDLNLGRYAWNAGASNNVRGFVMGGSASPAPTTPRIASIEVITMASTGDANIFGDLTKNSRRAAGCSSPTRAIHFTGRDDPARTKDIQFFTMATQGNAVKFGELTDDRDSFTGAFSSTTRGIAGGGSGSSTPYSNTIDYITIASEGNGTDFGDLTVNRISGGGMSSKTRGLFCGGYFSSPLSVKDEIDYVTIASTGNAADFGDLTTGTRNMDACSDVHGGLG
tara:strand:+ start:1047 stop:2075 length:1029 start_codon:yes stop_codon:yes gene_type:complete